MKKGISFLIFLSLIFNNFFILASVSAFESSGTSGNLSFEIHAGSINSITGSSSASNFAVFSGGGENALGLSIGSTIFQVFSSVVNWFFSVFTKSLDQNHFRWRNDNGTESTIGSQTIVLHPTSQGNYTGYTATGCTEDTGEWDCVNDQSANAGSGSATAHDSDTSNLNINGSSLSSFGIDNDMIPVGATVSQLEIFLVLKETANGGTGPSFRPFYRLNSTDYTCGSTSSHEGTTYTSFSCVFSSLSLSRTDLNNLEIGIENTANDANVTQVYVVATYSSSGATFADAEDTAHSDLAKSTPIRLRIGISNEGWSRSGDSSVQFRLQYSETATCSSGTYTDVPATATSEHWQMSNSANITDGDATTNVASGLTDTNANFLAGQIKDTGNQTSGITLTSDKFTEIEYSIEATTGSTAGANYCFRLSDNGSTSNFVYSSYPTITISAGGSPAINQIHYRWRNDNGSEVGASFAKGEDTISTDDFFAGDRVRLRFLFKNTGTGAATNYAFRLEHSSTSCSVWVNLPTPEIAGTGGSHWSMDYTSNLINDSATTDSNGLTNPTGTFTAGKAQTSNSTASVSTINPENFSEYEYSIVSNSNAQTGVNYCFRLTNAGDTSVFTYSSQPQITLTNRQRPFGGGSSSGDEGGGSGPVVGGGGSGGGEGGEGSGSGGSQGGGGSGGGGDLE